MNTWYDLSATLFGDTLRSINTSLTQRLALSQRKLLQDKLQNIFSEASSKKVNPQDQLSMLKWYLTVVNQSTEATVDAYKENIAAWAEYHDELYAVAEQALRSLGTDSADTTAPITDAPTKKQSRKQKALPKTAA